MSLDTNFKKKDKYNEQSWINNKWYTCSKKVEAEYCHIRLSTGVMLSFWGVLAIVIKLSGSAIKQQ